MALTHAEQNRLIVEHLDAVEIVAAQLMPKAARKQIPFEEIVSEGTEGLIKAARIFDPEKSHFRTWVSNKIRFAILNFINDWQDTCSPVDAGALPNQEAEFYEWQQYGEAPPYERWPKLCVTVDELLALFAKVSADEEAFADALKAATARELRMIDARFILEPPQHQYLDSVARAHNKSFNDTLRIVKIGLGRIKGRIAANAKKQRQHVTRSKIGSLAQPQQQQ